MVFLLSVFLGLFVIFLVINLVTTEKSGEFDRAE